MITWTIVVDGRVVLRTTDRAEARERVDQESRKRTTHRIETIGRES